MAKPVFKIEFPKVCGPQDPIGYFHRMADFGEDLYRQIEQPGYGAVSDCDHYFTAITIELTKRRHLATVRQVIDKALDHHQFRDDVILTRL